MNILWSLNWKASQPDANWLDQLKNEPVRAQHSVKRTQMRTVPTAALATGEEAMASVRAKAEPRLAVEEMLWEDENMKL